MTGRLFLISFQLLWFFLPQAALVSFSLSLTTSCRFFFTRSPPLSYRPPRFACRQVRANASSLGDLSR
jgi:hypothetical protein